MVHRSRCRPPAGHVLWPVLLLTAGIGPRAWAQCPPPGMTETFTWPVDGATLPPEHIRVQVTRGAASGLFYWPYSGPSITVKGPPCSCTRATTDLYMTPLGNNQFVWDFDASGFDAGTYEIDAQDPIWKMIPGDGVDGSYNCPPIAPNSYNAQIHITIGGTPTERALSSQTLAQLCLADQTRTQSDTSPLSGKQSWSVPITSWDYHGATFPFALTYNSLSMVDPNTVDSTSATPDDPLPVDYAGLSERNSKWTHNYAQWVEVVHDEGGAEYAVWHHGGGSLPFKKSGSIFPSPDSYHTLAFGGSASGTYSCGAAISTSQSRTGGSQSRTAPGRSISSTSPNRARART